MPRKLPVNTETPAEVPEGVAPVEPTGETKVKKQYVNKKKLETPFQKVTRRLARAKRAYEKLLEAGEPLPDTPEYSALAKAKSHLDGCAERYAKVANPEPEQEVAEPVA